MVKIKINNAFLLLLFVTINSFSQNTAQDSLKNQKIIFLKGLVTDCEGTPLNKVTIYNVKTKQIVPTDNNGRFRIKIKTGDFLFISYFSNFKNQKLQIIDDTFLTIKLLKSDTEYGTVGKPVIYLYPKTKTNVSLRLNFNGEILTTFPKYEGQWNVIANPSGIIYDLKSKRNYNSLFWDGLSRLSNEHYDYKTGFVVEKVNIIPFLIEKLEFMGLNSNETNEFIQFWLPILEKNEINLIHFWLNEDYNLISENIVNPKPETSIRIFMEFSKIKNNFKIEHQKLYKTDRKGFTLVEWGGCDVTKIREEIAISKL